MSPSSSVTRSCCAGRWTGSRCAFRCCACRPRRTGWPGSPTSWRSCPVPAVLSALSTVDRPLSTPALEARVELRRSRLELMLKVLDVDGAVRRVAGGWVATGTPWRHDTQRYARVAAARTTEQDAMREY